MPDTNDIDVNPGELLQRYLQDLFPLTGDPKSAFLSRIDSFVNADGDLVKTVYESTIHYLVRRLITTAYFIKRKYQNDELGQQKYIGELRGFLKNDLNVPTTKQEGLLSILVLCTDVSQASPSTESKKRLRRVAKEKSLRCYICGRDLDFNLSDEYIKAEVEHFWPNSLGGESKDFNFRVACAKCNRSKANYLGSCDFHYEEICLVHDQYDEGFEEELRYDYKVALYAKSSYQCVLCGAPAERVGTLTFGRKNPNDSWHFLNIEAYCAHHAPKRRI